MIAPQARRRLSGRWLLPFVVTFVLVGLWALTSPLFSGPDEPAQVIRSVSLVHGTLLGRPVAGPASPTTRVSIPAWLSGANTAQDCFAGKPDVSAQCEPPLSSASGSVVTTTYAGRYPPLYYAIVGWPSLIFSGKLALYLMRLASAAASAAFLAGALYCASRSTHTRGLVVGLALVLTPQVVFLAGVINPSGLEITSAICVWTAALVACEDGAPPGAVLGWLTAAAVVMVNIRGLSPLLLLVMGLTVALYAGRQGLLDLFRDRRTKTCLAGVVALGMVAVVWVLAAGALRVRTSGTPLPGSAGPWLTLGLTLENLGSETLQMVGAFGWVDTYLPAACYVLWLGLVAGFVCSGIGSKLTRCRATLVTFALATVAVPTALLLARSNNLGIFGQARDWMPLWVGLPLLVGHAIHIGPGEAGGWRGALGRWLRRCALGSIPVLQVFAWIWALRRYATGSGHLARSSPAAWRPPIPAPVLLGGVVICVAVLAWQYCRLRTRGCHPALTQCGVLTAPGEDNALVDAELG